MRSGYEWVKRSVDLIASASALVALGPAMAVIALAVKLDSPGPALFRQQRAGRGNRPFTLLKFRSMRVGTTGALVTAAGDRRVTRVGRFLRRTKLDELPQLVNVLVGDMSLVGPRPEVDRYVRAFPGAFAHVLTVRPGLTDFAALEYRNEEALLRGAPDPESIYTSVILPAKLTLYHRYLDEMSLGTDAILILRTLAALLR